MTSLPGSRLLRMPGLFCAVRCQLMQQRRVGCALNPAARVEDQTGIALMMGIGFRAKRCFFKMVCPRQIRMQIRI